MALRKLQAEIDRTLKKVSEGVELFESSHEKLMMSTNATQKDKLETDMKTQIKKLQKLRDQIKVWLAGNDIKDKSALLENRKLIETQMERFKALEKEMKTKAFSKEGLILAAKLDPAEKAKRDVIDWVQTMVDELSRQVEATEAEIEALQATQGKKARAKGGAGDRATELDTLNERRAWHMDRLEVVQRMLENGQLSVEQVTALKEDIAYFVESNTEEDFEEDEGLYDELNLQDEDADFGQNEDLSTHDDSSQVDYSEMQTPVKETPAKPSRQHTEEPPSTPASPIAHRKVPSRKTTTDTPKMETPVKPANNLPSKPTEVVQSPAAVTRPSAAAPLPPIKYAAAAAAAVAQASSKAAESAVPLTSPPLSSVQSPPVSVANTLAESLADVSIANGTEQQATAPTPSPQTSAPAPTSATPSYQSAPVAQATSQSQSGPSSHSGLSPVSVQAQAQGSSSAHFAEPSRSTGKEATVLGELMASYAVAKDMADKRSGDVNHLNAALDGSFDSAPQPADADPPRYYHPANPVQTPPYYPQTRAPILDDKTIYSRLEVDQLFYIFYYHTNTYEQWLAARELKRQSWRFHKQYLTWFQRAHNPQAITDEYEQGGYLYFDWENSWCQRRKSDFRFEYRWLSEH